jgi:hypothetical protein
MILRNIGDTPLRLCTLCGRWGSNVNRVHAEELTPHFFKSDAPSDSESAANTISLDPGGDVSLPITWGAIPDGESVLCGAYSVSREFGERHGTWYGYVAADALAIRVASAQPARRAAEALDGGSRGDGYTGTSVVRSRP